MTYDYAIHSDFLIHWTGKDIDAKYDSDWYGQHKPAKNPDRDQAYLARLRDTLRYGLWMTVEPGTTYGSVSVPDTPKCCFTELRISHSRRHAKEYGRLGIGVKRPFLFQRHGRPLVYFGYDSESDDVLLHACNEQLANRDLLNFFKPMNRSRMLNYDFYAESEWRLLYLKELEQARRIIDPRNPANKIAHAYFRSLPESAQDKLKYLVPLDGWFAMIIYPTIDAKNEAQWSDDVGVRAEIRRIKELKDHGNRVERSNWPIELNLDASRNF